ncbi:MAG: potassium transporter TrkG [Candidatus Brocadiia bacterium]
MMQLGGGAGLAIIMVAALTGPQGPGLYKAEGRSQLVPHVRRSAKLVVTLYAGYAALGLLALVLMGMQPFDALNHSFTAVSTGGFSTHEASIGHWDSAGIEAVTIALMVLGNLNFVTAYLLVRGRWKAVWRNGELRLFALLLVTATAAMLGALAGLYPLAGKHMRVAVFETASALTTTGFTSTTYSGWGAAAFWLTIVLMIIGGGACSTAGGLKQFRVYLLLKALWWKLRMGVAPSGAVMQPHVWDGEQKDYVTPNRLAEVGTFAFLYFLVLSVGVGVLAAHGFSLQDSLFEFASALGTVGLSVGVTSAEAPHAVLWAQTAGMFLGRLEFLIVFFALARLSRDLWHISTSD